MLTKMNFKGKSASKNISFKYLQMAFFQGQSIINKPKASQNQAAKEMGN
jgi:hypothetical protein